MIRITEDQRAAIRQLARQGLNSAGIATVLGVSTATVRRTLAPGKVPRRTGRPSPFHNPRTLARLHKHRAQGHSITQLVAAFGSSESAVRRALKSPH